MTKKIVIIGGGFAGLNVAKHIENKGYEITLVDKNNYIFFPPLLYQVATGFLEPSNICYPYRKMLRNKKNMHFKLGSVIEILPKQNKLILSSGALDYDYLVIATGTETNYFGMEQVKQKSIPMKTINDALGMRNYILSQLERATNMSDEQERLKALSIVVAGGGPTGVEISGMLAEMRASVFRKDYPEFEEDFLKSPIYLVDGAENLLSPMSKKSQEGTYEALKKLGVQIMLGIQVRDYINDEVILSNGEKINSENLIWAAGVTAQTFDGIDATSYGQGKRLLVNEYNEIQGYENLFAVGDTCLQKTDSAFSNGHPQVAQVALQQGKNLAWNFDLLLKNKTRKAFHYIDRGSMAIIGRNKAVADLPPNLHFKGFVAWFIWVFIHLISLVHYRNRVTTLYNWVVAYFTKDQALRMIIRPSVKDKRRVNDQ